MRHFHFHVALAAFAFGSTPGWAQDRAEPGVILPIPSPDRWIVHLNTPAPSLDPFRQARRAGASRQELEAILRDVDQRTQAARQNVYRRIAELGGEVTAPWWIVNACAVKV